MEDKKTHKNKNNKPTKNQQSSAGNWFFGQISKETQLRLLKEQEESERILVNFKFSEQYGRRCC